MPDLTGSQSRFLRSLGHNLKPCVLLGKQGITPNVIKQIQDSLRAHELVKVRLQGVHGPERDEQAQEIAAATRAFLVQTLGCMVLLYRPNQEKPVITLPKRSSRSDRDLF